MELELRDGLRSREVEGRGLVEVENVIGHITGVADTSLAPEVTHDEVALWAVSLDMNQAATVAWLIRRGTSLKEWTGF